jgi:hypothetical protein
MTAMTVRHAACSCGKLAVSVRGEPVRISVCHCLECQRRTGSAFGVQARFRKTDVEITGESTAYRRIAESGNAITFHFCPHCGSTVYYLPESGRRRHRGDDWHLRRPGLPAADGPTTILSGKVTGVSKGDRVVVWLHGAETYRTTTDEDGRWVVRSVRHGTSIVRPDHRRYSFNPPTQVVRVKAPVADAAMTATGTARS